MTTALLVTLALFALAATASAGALWRYLSPTRVVRKTIADAERDHAEAGERLQSAVADAARKT